MEVLLQTDFEFIYQSSSESLPLLRGKKLLLTGGTGFFGKWILGFLNYANRVHDLQLEIHVLSRNPDRFLEHFPQFKHELLHFIKGDIRTFSFEKAVDFVIHAATEASAKLNEERPSEMFDVIVQGTKQLLKVCETVGVGRILITSSGAVYGKQSSEITHQNDESLSAPDIHSVANAYAEGKRVSELLGAFHSQETGQTVNFARCYAFVGPYLPLDSHFAIGNFINDCLEGREISIKGDGTACRSYMYAADLVIWLVKILTHGKNVRSYNVGSEDSVSIGELAAKVESAWLELTGSRVGFKILGIAQSDAQIQRYVPKTERASVELGLRLGYSFENSLLKTLTWNANMV